MNKYQTIYGENIQILYIFAKLPFQFLSNIKATKLIYKMSENTDKENIIKYNYELYMYQLYNDL